MQNEPYLTVFRPVKPIRRWLTVLEMNNSQSVNSTVHLLILTGITQYNA
jgi:hypothetical protein